MTFYVEAKRDENNTIYALGKLRMYQRNISSCKCVSLEPAVSVRHYIREVTQTYQVLERAVAVRRTVV